MAHLFIHSLRRLLAHNCLPLFTSDGLHLYFSALTAHFGQWREVRRRGRKLKQWQVAAGLIYGQVKKSYRRRTLVPGSAPMCPRGQTKLTVVFPPPIPRAWRSCSRENGGADGWRNATESGHAG